MRGAAISLAVLLALDASAGAQPPGPGSGSVPAPVVELDAPTVSAAVSAEQVLLGDEFYLFVKVIYTPGMQVNLPASLPLGPAFEERRRTDEITANQDGTVTREFEIALQAFEVGDLTIAPFPVTWAAHGRAQEVATNPVSVQVSGAIGEGEATLRDISGPVPVERRDLTLIYVGAAIAGAILLALAFLIGRRAFRRRRRRALARLPEALQRSAHDEALARLDGVEASGTLDAEDRKPAYLDMSEILRAYIGRRYGFPALDLTTVEIRRHFEARADGQMAAELVVPWLEQSDLVKFAGYDATPDEARQALYDARIFIDRTRVGAGTDAAAAPATPPRASA